LQRELPLYFTQVLGEKAWVGSKYTGICDLTLENTKLLVKLLTPETANIKNIFDQKTLLYVEAKENQLLVSKDGCDMLSISPRAFSSIPCVLTPSEPPMFPPNTSSCSQPTQGPGCQGQQAEDVHNSSHISTDEHFRSF
jgi:hypothetical protein